MQPTPTVRVCLGCQWKFITPDSTRVRRCSDCKSKEDAYQPPLGRISPDAGNIRGVYQ
jgi:hypothetical protein